MAYYGYGRDRYQGGYNVGYRPTYYERDMYRPYHDLAPVAFRQEPFYDNYRRDYRQEPFYDNYRRDYRQEPFYDNYRRDYRQGGFCDGRHGVLPMEEVYRREEAPHWRDQGRYHHGRQSGGYRLDRYDHGHGEALGHGGFFHDGEDDYRRHDNRHSSRTAVELYVPICCDKCERKLKKHLKYIGGVENITVDQTTKKVVVFGHLNPSHVLNSARQDKPEAEFWHSQYG